MMSCLGHFNDVKVRLDVIGGHDFKSCPVFEKINKLDSLIVLDRYFFLTKYNIKNDHKIYDLLQQIASMISDDPEGYLLMYANLHGYTCVPHLMVIAEFIKPAYSSNIWRIRNLNGETPAHWVARCGVLDAPYDDDIWQIQDESGKTPLHIIAEIKELDIPIDSPLWYIRDYHGVSVAHCAAKKNLLKVPYTSNVWKISDENGYTPAHHAAEYKNFMPPLDSPLWVIKNRYNISPISIKILNQKIDIPYDSPLWMTTCGDNIVASLQSCCERVFLYADELDIRNVVSTGLIKKMINEPLTLQGFCGCLRLLYIVKGKQLQSLLFKRLSMYSEAFKSKKVEHDFSDNGLFWISIVNDFTLTLIKKGCISQEILAQAILRYLTKENETKINSSKLFEMFNETIKIGKTRNTIANILYYTSVLYYLNELLKDSLDIPHEEFLNNLNGIIDKA